MFSCNSPGRVDLNGQAHALRAPLAGIVEQVTEHLHQTSAVTGELTGRAHREFEREVLVAVDLQQRSAQIGRHRDRN